MPIYELGLDELVEKNVKEGRLSSRRPWGKRSVKRMSYSALSVPRKTKRPAKRPPVCLCCRRNVAKNLNGYKILVNKSTVPVGTADQTHAVVWHPARGRANRYRFQPGILREGAAIKDSSSGPRRRGVSSDRARLSWKNLSPIARAGRPVVITDVRSAELIKYAANAFSRLRLPSSMRSPTSARSPGPMSKKSRVYGLDSRIGSRFCMPVSVTADRVS